MAVVTKYGTNYTEYGVDPRTMVDPQVMHGRVRICIDTVEVANGDSATSTLTVAKLPSNALILPQSMVYYDAITSLNDVDFGDSNDVDGLIDGDDFTSAGSASLLQAIDISEYGQKLWEMLGYSADPKGQIDLFFTLNAGAGADGTITVIIFYVLD